jgi:Glycosyltransferase family 87
VSVAEERRAGPARRLLRGPANRLELAGWWIVTRVVTLLVLATPAEHGIIRDVYYYGNQLEAMFRGTPVTQTLREYPLPAFAVFLTPRWLSEITPWTYASIFVGLMLVLDAAFVGALWRVGRAGGVRLWLVLVPLLGPLTFTRFDLVSAALAGFALLALATRRPAAAGLLAAAGAAVKLWPAALLPGLLVRRERPGRVLAGFVAAGVVAVGVTLAVGGTTRLLSPLTWQGDRGLQLETVWAVPLLFLRCFDSATWSTPYTEFLAFQVEGPGAGTLLHLSTVATVACALLLCYLWWRSWQAGPASPALVGLLAVAAACLLIVPNKTLSPQYLLWIGGALAALGATAPDEPLLPRLNVLLLIGCALTQILYPIGYGMLTGPNWANAIGATLLLARNGILVAITWFTVRRILRLTRREPAAA